MTTATKKMAPKKAAKRKTETPLWLDIACGQRKGNHGPDGQQDPTGWTGIDIADTDAADLVHDLTIYPWPFVDNSVDKARCSHYVEHIPHDVGLDVDGFIAFGNELHRILKPGAQCEIWAPYYTSMRAWQDPTHTRAITDSTFLYWNQEWLVQNGLDHYGVTADFDFSYGYNFSNPYWVTAHEEKRQFALTHYWNVADDIYVTLTKRG